MDDTDGLYAKYGKPLEAEHWGKYIAIRQDGRVMVDEYMDVLDQRARAEWGDARALFTQVGGSAGPPKLLHPCCTQEQQQASRRMQETGDRLYAEIRQAPGGRALGEVPGRSPGRADGAGRRLPIYG